MKLRPPADRKSVKAKVAWLLRQLEKTETSGVHVRLTWPGRSVPTQHSLESLRANVDIASAGRDGWVLFALEIVLVRDLGARFAQRRNFIGELEATLPLFYEQIGQRLKAWQAPAPRLSQEKSDAEAVSPEAIAQQAEAAAGAEEGWVDRPPEPTPAIENVPPTAVGVGRHSSDEVPSPSSGDGTP